MTLDLAVLAVIAVAALLGAAGGALRQVVQLAAVLLGWLAARKLGAPVAEGFARSMPALLARAAASALLFLGTFAAASLLGALLLRATGLARVVRGPADRGIGALLGGAKGALAVWVLLSAVALAGGRGPRGLALDLEATDFGGLARRHNLLLGLDPKAAGLLGRALRTARDAERRDRSAGDPEARRLLADPRVRALVEGDGEIDTAEAARLLEDPEVRALIERVEARERAAASGAR
jgi:membrane protein required for colicin V production